MITRTTKNNSKLPVFDYGSNNAVYMLTAVDSNARYIGQSHSLRQRIYCHYRDLQKNIHVNVKLQESYNKLGDAGIEIEVLEYFVDNNELQSQLKEAESFWTWRMQERYEVQGSTVQNLYEASSRASTSHKANKERSYDETFIKSQIALWTKRLDEVRLIIL